MPWLVYFGEGLARPRSSQLGLFTSCVIFICWGGEPAILDYVEMRVRPFCGFEERGNLTETNVYY